MGLQSALFTSLTGLTAAETSIDVAGNNVANANTVGFKESKIAFATQFLQTQSIGSAPTDNRGGTNPRQIGLGVKVAEISPEFTQGTIQISSNPLDLAVQGDGFFIVQGTQGEQLYTRNGQFKTNSENEIVTVTGQRVLGYGVNDNFEIEPTGLTALRIPLGNAAVARATETVFMEGALNPNGEVGATPQIIQSGVLSDGSTEVPDDDVTLSAIARPAETTTPAASGTVGSVGIGTYSYRITYVDANGQESPASNITSNVNIAAAGASIDLSGIPSPGSGYTGIRLYRNNSAVDTTYRLVTTLGTSPSLPYNDGASDASIAANATLSDTGLTDASYSYYVTFYNSATTEESRPTARFGPQTADATNSPRIRLSDIPEPTTTDYDQVRIYRNLATNPNEFHLVTTLNPTTWSGTSYIDNTPDSVISTAAEINLDGPAISAGLPLVDVWQRSGSTYAPLFQQGELSFSGTKGGRSLGEQTLTITATTTVQDLITFMEESMGILKTAGEASFPDGGFTFGSTTYSYGGAIVDSKLVFMSNMGEANALSIDLSAFQLTPTASSTTSTVGLDFTSLYGASADSLVDGEGATADFVVYDSLGSPLSVRITTVLEEVTDSEARFRWIATSPDNQPLTGNTTIVGTGVLVTDGEGKFISTSNDRIGIDRAGSPAASPLEFQLDFNQITGLDQGKSEISASRQDGFPAGTLTSFIITETGKIQGVFSNGSTRDLGQLRMARFANNSGLEQRGDNLFAAGVNSGLPIQGDPGSQGIGSILAGSVELSNTDIGQNLIELILASTQYRGGARVITAVQELLDELLALRR